MTSIVLLKLADFFSLFSAVDVSVEVVITPLRLFVGSPAQVLHELTKGNSFYLAVTPTAKKYKNKGADIAYLTLH